MRYMLCGPLGHRMSSGEEALNRLPKDVPCLVLLHPGEVSLLAVVPPKLTGKKLKDALPFLVEPLLLNEPEENFVSLWPQLSDSTEGEQLAAVVSKSRIRSVVGLCRQMGLSVAGISTEALLPPAPGAVWAWTTGNQFLLMDGKKPPLVMDWAQASSTGALLQRRLAQAVHGVWMPEDDQKKISQADGPMGEAGARLGQWLKPLISPKRALKPDQLNYTLLSKRPLLGPEDLRKMGMKSKLGGRPLWRELLVPGLAFGLTALLGLNVWALRVSTQESVLENQIAVTYSQALPTTPMVADPLLLIEREIKTLGSGAQSTNAEGLSYVLHEVGTAMESAPFNSLQDMAYEGGKLRLKFGANVQDTTRNETVQRLKARNIPAKWTSAEGGQAQWLELDWGGKR